MIEYFVPISDKSKTPKLTKVQQEQLVVNAVEEWQTWTTTTQDKRAMSREARQFYFENKPALLPTQSHDDNMDTSANVRRPVLAEAVDALIAQQHQASFPSDERFYKGRARTEFTSSKLDNYERSIEQRLSEGNFLYNSLIDRQSAILDGVSLVWHPFIRVKRPKVEYEPVTIMGVRLPIPPKKSTIDKVVLETTGYVPVSFDDYVIDPLVDNFDEASLIWRRWMSPDEVKSMKGLKNTDEVNGYYDFWSDEKGSDKLEYYRNIGLSPLFEARESNKGCLLYEKWGDFWIDGDVYENHVLIFSNDAVFHHFGPNPYDHGLKPFSAAPYIPVAGSLYGKSAVQDTLPLANALDAMTNDSLDIFRVTSKPSFEVDVNNIALWEYMTDNGGMLKLRAGEGLPSSGLGGIAPIVWDRSALQEAEGFMMRLKEEIRESTGGVSYATGGISELDAQRTATEVNRLATGTETRFRLLIQIYEELKLKRFMTMFFENDRQFMTEAIMVNDDPEPITPEDVKFMDLVFDITGSQSIINKNQEIQELDGFILNLLPQLIQNGFAVPNGDILKINIPDLIKDRLSKGSLKNMMNIIEVETVEDQQEAMSEQQDAGLGSGIDESTLLPGLTGGGAPEDMGGLGGPAGLVAA